MMTLLLALLLQEEGTYKFLLGDEQVGEEKVAFTKTGWKAKGACDIAGTLKAEYEAELDGGKWKLRYKDQERELKQDLDLDTLGKKTNPVFFANLVWACFIPLGQAFAGGATEVTGIFSEKVDFPIRLKETSRSGPFTVFLVDLGGVECKLLCTAKGLPVRIAVPMQQVEVVYAGYENSEFPGAEPITIVDSGAWRKLLSPAKHDVKIDRKVSVPMRDGVKLVADVYAPKAEGKFPVVLARTPYGRGTEGMLKGSFFARRGYVFVAVDVRGRGESEGEWFPFRNEEKDGYDTIDWIAKQPWCDGNVGMIGASYVGVVQWYAAKSRHPNLKAIVPQVSPPDPDQNIPYEGGVFVLATAWWAKMLDNPNGKVDWDKAMKTLPLSELDVAVGTKMKFLDEWLAHPPSDEKYWAPFRYQNHEMNVAVLNISGWFDGDQPGAPQNFVGRRKHKHQFLIMGPWTHFFNSSRTIGKADFGPEAVIDLDHVELRFFDRYLKGIDNGMDGEDPVAVFVMGENKWRKLKDWPSQTTSLYLSGGKPAKRDGDGRLVAGGAKGAGEFRYDPMNPPKTLADFEDMSGAAATADQSVLEDREDILDYTSAPLAESADVIGDVKAILEISTDAEDTDFAVEVFRLTSDGKMYAIAGGIQRVRYRNGKDEPAKRATIEVDCWATGVRLAKGDRIRVQVSSWAFPGYARNLNTLESPLTAKAAVVATNRVQHGTSRIVLPTGALKFE